ncbi:MAG TPA: hypothetical protein VHT93_12605 [Pseudolabrys sp.]|jgi:hypothetical protein|nr:hypothetical protein [Pseudolabrys sp.]
MLACAVPTSRRITAAVVFIVFAVPAFAQGQKAGDEAYALASPPSNPTDQQSPSPSNAAPLPDESAVLSSVLTFDPAAMASMPIKPLKQPSLGNRDTLAVTRTNSQPDGSGTVSVKQGLQQPLPTNWSANVGTDLSLAPNTSPLNSEFGQPLPMRGARDSGGAAWATLGVDNLASLDARVDPTNDQGRIGTTLQRSIPFGSRFSVTVQDTYSVTESFSNPGASAPSDIPVMSMPAASANPAQVWDNQRGVKFGILPTGTTFGASTATSSIDPETHNTFSAEQKLLGPLNVTTAVTDIGKPTESKSIAAGFKFNW